MAARAAQRGSCGADTRISFTWTGARVDRPGAYLLGSP
ncbi:hypothetical protein J2S46_003517 [Kitasatospora herbaricolor]|nr:hypothetical protein [Kitasatospora herbaricolor]